ncbi:hypothetical protein ACFOU2_08765 [Bacillus songklensis]|uniref:Uncharacterized protein n=1 Tax=Bacillus songklensis TaxID=1069116 RepID=A0ABV8B180_9BACI
MDKTDIYIGYITYYLPISLLGLLLPLLPLHLLRLQEKALWERAFPTMVFQPHERKGLLQKIFQLNSLNQSSFHSLFNKEYVFTHLVSWGSALLDEK